MDSATGILRLPVWIPDLPAHHFSDTGDEQLSHGEFRDPENHGRSGTEISASRLSGRKRDDTGIRSPPGSRVPV